MDLAHGPIIVADDYGLGSDHNKIICELISKGCINATSVLIDTVSAEDTLMLKQAAQKNQQIGLHLNLTLTANRAEFSQPVRKLLVHSIAGQLDLEIIGQRISEQIERFENLFGGLPGFIDGHEHCHTFPGIDDCLIHTVKNKMPHKDLWIRSPSPKTWQSKWRALRIAGAKTLPVMALGERLRRKLVSHNIPTNRDFSGFLPLDRPDCVRRYLPRLLASAGPATVIMVHPGALSDRNQIANHPAESRAIEAQILKAWHKEPAHERKYSHGNTAHDAFPLQ